MMTQAADDNAGSAQSRYRVVGQGVPALLTSVHLRPDGWDGPDLYMIAIGGDLDCFPIGSVHVVRPEQRQRWRDAGHLI